METRGSYLGEPAGSAAETTLVLESTQGDGQTAGTVTDDGGGASRSTDPAGGSSTGTDVSLREYIVALIAATERASDARFDAMKEMVENAFRSSQEAIRKAEAATEKRFESVNEFRAVLTDQQQHLVTRQVLDSVVDRLQAAIERNREDLDALAKRLDLREGKEGDEADDGRFVRHRHGGCCCDRVGGCDRQRSNQLGGTVNTYTVATSSVAPKPIKCATCGHDSSRNNYLLDFTKKRSYEICSYCRQELKEAP